MHCHNFLQRPMTRRQMLRDGATGFGSVALAALMSDWNSAKASPATTNRNTATTSKGSHYQPKVKNVIFLYMDGGPSHIDIFDYKPILEKFHDQDPRKAIGKLEPTQFNNIGKVMMSPWKFKRHGESGNWVSELFPHIATQVDDLAFVKGMTSKFSEHTAGNYFLHTGSGFQGRPSMGAWVSYGLGTENENLPGFVVLNGGLIPPGGLDNFNSGFLPATFQGSIFKPSGEPVANIRRTEASSDLQRRKLDLLRQLDQDTIDRVGEDDQLESAIANYETAFRMQTAVPELMDLATETEATKRMYGFDEPWRGTKIFARQCLVARRLVERGVRFVELTCPGGNGDRWDQHAGLKTGHERNCVTVDRPIAALIKDLKMRGLFDSTLLVWTGEFGRTPFAQGRNGRDHNPFGFTLWMAGGGIKGGVSYGETDEWGYKAIDGKQEIHDLHATMLHLLGIEHTKSTFRFSGRDMRLTDVHGHIIHEVLS